MHEATAKSRLKADELALLLSEAPLTGMINLRGALENADFAARAEKALGFPLARRANSFTAKGARQCIWQGPDEWLIMVPIGDERALAGQFDVMLEGLHHAVTDVTGNRLILRLEGARARPLLAAGCSYDVSAPNFRTGDAVQTILARTPVTILKLDVDRYEIHIRRSYARYLFDWLFSAADLVDVP